MMRLVILCAVFACLTASSAHGQDRTRVVRGRVVDHGTGAPLAGASVRLDGREVTAGNDGEFRLCGVAPGRVVARAAAGGRGRIWRGFRRRDDHDRRHDAPPQAPPHLARR
jgi:protocatechuate 3,4-dioxygenase beta subunit